MIYVKKQLAEGATVQINLAENDEFYTYCYECGKEIEATEEVLDDFSGFLFGANRIFCAKCTEKRRASENIHEK